MIQKLVRINPATGDYAEVDKVRLKRETLALLDYIKQNINEDSDELGIWKEVVPLCEAVLNESIPLPVSFPELPLKYAVREGLLPKHFSELFSAFSITVSGTAREIFDTIDVNGEPYTYANFET